MVKVSFDQKPYRKLLIQTYGATVHGSPSTETEFGRKVLAEDPNSSGSLGIAISEAIEHTVKTPNTNTPWAACSTMLPASDRHRSGAIKQMEMAGEYPDVVIGCVGGGSNFAGSPSPLSRKQIKSSKEYRILAAEPASCPSLTQGELRYDFGDTAEMTPLMMMYTLGHDFMPPVIHSGGLRYHGMSPMVSHCKKLGLIDAVAVPQMKVFQSGIQFARTEGIVPAPESAHAIAVAIDEAVRCREENRKQVIVFNLSGNGLLDLAAYDTYLSGKMHESGKDI